MLVTQAQIKPSVAGSGTPPARVTRPDLAPFPRSAPAVSNPHGLGADTQQLVQAQ